MSRHFDDYETKNQPVDDPWGYQEDPNEEDLIRQYEEGVQQTPPPSPAMNPQPASAPQPELTGKAKNPFVTLKQDAVTETPFGKNTPKQSAPVKPAQSNTPQQKRSSKSSNDSSDQKKPTQKDNMLAIVKGQDVFLDQDKVPYVSIEIGRAHV